MKCSNCGNEIPSAAKFCTKCGTPVSQGQSTDKMQAIDSNLGNIGTSRQEELSLDNSEPSAGTTQKGAKQPFAWKEQYTYIAVAAVIVLAAVVGFAVKTSRSADDGSGSDYAAGEITENGGNDGSYQQDGAMAEESGNITDGAGADYGAAASVDVEEDVLAIREQYNDIVDKINADSFYHKVISNGSSAYYDGSMIKALTVPENADGNSYARSYFYDDNGSLIFACYEADDANRLYFTDSQLIRWRYSPDALDPQNAEDHDLENSSGYFEWENKALNDSHSFVQMMEDADDIALADYILPGSDSRYLDKGDLDGLSAAECRFARNELYARHGRKFDDEELQMYFNSKDWYEGTIDASDFGEDMLNDYEVYNRDLIVDYEKEMGYR